MLPMQVGQATRPFGSIEDGVRVLVMCGRDEADLGRADLRPGLQPAQRRTRQHARPPLPARPAPRCGDRLPLGRMDAASPLAVSLGDPAGIGPEVIGKCWDHRGAFGLPPFVAVGDPRSLAAVWDGPIVMIDDPRDVDSAFDVGLPLVADDRGAGRHARPPERRRGALLARRARACGRAGAVGRGVGGRHRPGVEAAALRASASPTPGRPSSSPSAAACRRPMSR